MDQLVQYLEYFMENLLVDMAFSVLFSVIKNPRKVAQLKAALRKLRDKLTELPLDV